MGLFDAGHVAKLHKIQSARLSAGQEGIGLEVEELIRRLEMGGVNQRRIQAKCLWDCGFGCDPSVRAKNFNAYLTGIPQISECLLKDDHELQLLSLADPRPGLLRICNILGIQYRELGYSEDSAESFDQRFPLPTKPFWFRHDNGRKNSNRRSDHCRDELVGDIMAGTAMEGIFALVHHLNIVEEDKHGIDLPRTVYCGDRMRHAYIGVFGGWVNLHIDGVSDITNPAYGTLRVRRK